jgi:hypothetical protein
MENKEIFLVTTGDYSDYRVCGVFDKKELAQKYIKSFTKDSYTKFRIEEYPLNPYKFELTNNYKPYFLRMTKEGNCTEIFVQDSDYNFKDGTIDLGFDINNNLYVSVFAKDRKHAIKIANEKRVQLIAANKWKVSNKK